MVLLGSLLVTIIVTLLVIIVSAFPLHLAISVLGGRSSILKAFFVMIVTGLVVVLITPIFAFGRILAFLLLIWIYRETFRLKWYKAFIAWFLQIIFLLVMIFIFKMIGLGILVGYFFF